MWGVWKNFQGILVAIRTPRKLEHEFKIDEDFAKCSQNVRRDRYVFKV